MTSMDYEIARCTRQCSATGRTLAEGEEFCSALVRDGAEVRRLDFSLEAWSGPPEGALGWWRSRVPAHHAKKSRLAPNEVMLGLFHELADVPEKHDMRYVLSLLLVRRRVFRLEDTRTQDGQETLIVYCHREDATYEVPAMMPDDARADEIQAELARLLFAGAEGTTGAEAGAAANADAEAPQ